MLPFAEPIFLALAAQASPLPKPRIRRYKAAALFSADVAAKRGWSCVSAGRRFPPMQAVGFGASPTLAYADWLMQL